MKTKVSIICITYNQEKYIAEAIESFLMQKTTFNYEIIIHDDCSTDNTAKIIKKYEKKYPDKIQAIYQSENQYSQGIRIIDDILIPIAKGEYIAFCEGDDYWNNEYKLQKQVEELDKHPECDICTHAVAVVDSETKKRIGMIRPSKSDKLFSVEEVIRGDGGFVGTNSIVMRKAIWNCKYIFRKNLQLDYTLQIMGTLRGGMIYIDLVMAAYRYRAPSSWTRSILTDSNKNCKHHEQLIAALKQLDYDTSYKYNNIIEEKIKYHECQCIIIKREYKRLFKKENRNLLSCLSWKERIKVVLKMTFPCINKFLDWRRHVKYE